MMRERDAVSSLMQEAHHDTEVGEHSLNARDVLGGGVKVGEGPKFIAHDFSPIPAERLNEPESGLGMSAPRAMDDGVALRPGVIDLVKQVNDNFLRRIVFDLNLGQRT